MADTMEIWATRAKNIDPSQFVGQQGRIFYYPDSGTLRISDGNTVGGLPINLTGNISDLAFGNFIFSNTTITTSTVDADITIATNGNGELNLVTTTQVNVGGAFHIHTNGNLSSNPYFDVATTGETRILVPVVNFVPGISVIGNDTGNYQAPQNTGVMSFITGQQDLPSRFYNDGVANYAASIGRRYNGTPTAPTQVLDGQIINRVGATPYTDTGWPAISTARVDFVQHGNATSSNYGSQIEFWTTPLNSTTISRAAYINGDTLYGNNITTSGIVNIVDTSVADNVAVLTVTNNTDGNTRRPVLANVVAQFTGQDNKTPYIIYDGYGNVNSAVTGPEFTMRAARGNLAVPAAVQNNDALGKIGAAGWGTTGYGGVFASHIEFQAAGTFTDISRPGKIVFKAIPDGSTTQATALTLTPTAAVFNDGMMISNAAVHLPAGTSSQTPLQFTAGSLLTTPTPGAMNYDGSAFYATPVGLSRGLLPAQQQFVLNTTRNLTAGTTAAQSVFGSAVRLEANTRYYYEMTILVAKNGSASNQPTINYGLSVGGGGSITSHFYTVNSSVTATLGSVNSGSEMFNYITTGFATGVPVTAAMPISTSYARVAVKGYIDMNVAGTIDFQIAFSDAPNSSCSIQPKSGIFIYPVSPAGQNTNVGSWT